MAIVWTAAKRAAFAAKMAKYRKGGKTAKKKRTKNPTRKKRTKKVWTPAMRAAFAQKMAKYRKGPKRSRAKNPKKAGLRVGQIVDWKTGEGTIALTRGKKILGKFKDMKSAQAAYRARKRRKNPAGRYSVYVNGKKRGGVYDAATAKLHAYALAYHHPRAVIVVK